MVGARVPGGSNSPQGGCALKVEIVGVGTELLLGQIANTNAQKISQGLAAIGVDVHFHSVVGDNLKRISDVLQHALERADAVIVTGGLGPTPDDITSEAIARAVGVELKRDERLAGVITDIFRSLGRAMPEDNLKQADLPVGAAPIAPEGTAPGFWIEAASGLVFALPGVPWEMEAMLAKTILPLLASRIGAATTVSREVMVVGVGESRTHELIKDLVAAQSNPTIAYLAGRGQVRVRLSAKAPSEADAQALIAPLEEEIRRRLGSAALPGTRGSLADRLSAVIASRDVTVAVAESLTGGLIAAELTTVPGASGFFLGSLVCYSTGSKETVAGVPAEILVRAGAVSEETAAALAEGAARVFGANVGISATGVAGPDHQEGKPKGTIHVAVAFEGRAEVNSVTGYGDRGNVRAMAVTAALDLARRVLDA
ncbi:MAG: competence/damage-inducible protein A [Actinobacteria bacterium]|nr:competence/damage-inducible protein A [Actinomycetota bacterium]